MSILKINRPFGLVNGARKYKVYIDGDFSGKIGNGETKEFPVTEGEHTVKVTIDWCSSNTISCVINPDESKELKIQGIKHFRYMFILGVIAVFLLTLENLRLYAAIPIILLFVYTIYFLTFGRDKYLRIL